MRKLKYSLNHGHSSLLKVVPGHLCTASSNNSNTDSALLLLQQIKAYIITRCMINLHRKAVPTASTLSMQSLTLCPGIFIHLLLKAPMKRHLPMFGVISPLLEFAVKLFYMLSNLSSNISKNDSNLSSRQSFLRWHQIVDILTPRSLAISTHEKCKMRKCSS